MIFQRQNNQHDVTIKWSEQFVGAKNLVDLSQFCSDIILEIRYATDDNFVKRPIYESKKCYLHKNVVQALLKVQNHLKRRGLGLKVWDAYRPLWNQQMLWDFVQDERYVSHPGKGGRHTRGTAVDVTLVHFPGHQELVMPSGFDEFSEKAHRNFDRVSEEEKSNRKLLEDVMVSIGGFDPFPFEWWHFDFSAWQAYPPLNVSFSQLEMYESFFSS